jgi:hypothetical protein
MSNAATVLVILSLAELCSLFTSTGALSLLSLDRLKFIVTAACIEALANISLSVIFVTYFDAGMSGVAYGTLVPMVIFRGLITPLYAMKILTLSASEYLKQIVSRVTLLFTMTLLVFVFVSSFAGGSWWRFSWAVLFSTIAYALSGASILIGMKPTLSYLRRAWALVSQKGWATE